MAVTVQPSVQGLVTNDVAALEDQRARPMYACILNAQGRFLHDLFMHRQPGECVPVGCNVVCQPAWQDCSSVRSTLEECIGAQGASQCSW